MPLWLPSSFSEDDLLNFFLLLLLILDGFSRKGVWGRWDFFLEERKITHLLRCNSNLVNDFLLFLSVLLIAMKAIKGTLVTWLVQSKDKETREQLT